MKSSVTIKSPDGDSISCKVASDFWSRFRGLMGKPPPPDGSGLLIVPCNSIHMFFMKFPIDVVFLDKEFRIVRTIFGLNPGQIIGTVRDAIQAIEIESGRLPKSFEPGVRLEIFGS